MRTNLLIVLLFARVAWAQSDLSGDWMLSIFDSVRPTVMRLVLKVEGEKLSGFAIGRPLTGTVKGNQIEFKVDENSPSALFPALT